MGISSVSSFGNLEISSLLSNKETGSFQDETTRNDANNIFQGCHKESSSDLRKLETFHLECGISDTMAKAPQVTDSVVMNDLITFQSNINKTLESLVESIKRTEYTRDMLRRNSLDSPFHSAFHQSTKKVVEPIRCFRTCKRHDFSNVNENLKHSFPKSPPIKAIRRPSLGKPRSHKNRSEEKRKSL